MNEQLCVVKDLHVDETSTLLSSITAYMRDDRSEAQAEILKLSTEVKKLRK